MKYYALALCLLSRLSVADITVPSNTYPFNSGVGAPGYVKNISVAASLGIDPTSYGTSAEGSVIDDPRCSVNGPCATATAHQGYFQSGVAMIRFGKADYPDMVPPGNSRCTIFVANTVLFNQAYTNEAYYSNAVASPNDALSYSSKAGGWAVVNGSIAFVSDGLTVPMSCTDLQTSNEVYAVPFTGNSFFIAVGNTPTRLSYYYSRNYDSGVLYALMPGNKLVLQTSVVICNGPNWGARGTCSMSREAHFTWIGSDSGVIPIDPPVCDVAGDLTIDLGTVSKRTAVDKKSNTILSLSCTKSANASLKIMNPKQSNNGLSMNIGFGENLDPSLLTSVGKKPVNVNVLAKITNILNDTSQGSYTFSTPLVILYD